MAEDNWNGSTEEKKFLLIRDIFIKSTLREREWQSSPVTGCKHEPKMAIERARNEAANLKFIQQSTNIPVPKVLCEYEDDGAYVIVMTRAKGVPLQTLSSAEKAVVIPKIPPYIHTLHQIKSSMIGGASGIVCPPYSILNQTPHDKCHWSLKCADSEKYVFCHMDAHQGNIFVDPRTLEITCFIDFEFAGFYPEHFDLHRYEHDPSKPLNLDKFNQEFTNFIECQRYGSQPPCSRVD